MNAYGMFGFPPASYSMHKIVKMGFGVGETDEVDESMLSWFSTYGRVPATEF